MKTIVKVLIVVGAFHLSFWVGVLVLGIMLMAYRDSKHWEMAGTLAAKKITEDWQRKYKSQNTRLNNELRKKNDKIQSILDAVQDEEEIDKNFKEPSQMPQRFVPYGDFIIEDYGGWYIVKDPEMKSYPKMFMNIAEAQKTVDRLKLEYTPIKHERSKIHNVRFVR